MLTSLYSLSHFPNWLVFPLRYTKTLELSGKLWVLVVFGPFRILRASLTWRFALSFCTFAIAFLTAKARCAIDADKGLYSVIRGYTL